MDELFAGDLNVFLSGEDALEIININLGEAHLKVNGFQSPSLELRDLRSETPAAIKKYQTTHTPEDFYRVFNHPAYVEIHQKNKQEILITLAESTTPDPDNYLWIGVGLKDEIPAYDYILWEIHPNGNGKFSILAVFTGSTENETQIDINFSEQVMDACK